MVIWLHVSDLIIKDPPFNNRPIYVTLEDSIGNTDFHFVFKETMTLTKAIARYDRGDRGNFVEGLPPNLIQILRFSWF